MDSQIIEISRSEAKLIASIIERCLGLPKVNAFRFHLRNDLPVKKCSYTYENILDAICEASGISKENLKGSCRKREYVDMRAVTSAIIHELWPKLSLREVGMFTNKSHAAVFNHLDNTENITEVQKLFQEIKLKLNI